MIQVVNKKDSADDQQKELATKKIIAKLRRQSEEEEASVFAKKIGFPYIDTNLFPISTDDMKNLKEEEARKYNTAVIQKKGRSVVMVAIDPINQDTQKFMAHLKQEFGWEIKLYVISRGNFNQILEKYKKILFVDFLDQLSINLSQQDISHFEKALEDLIKLKQRINELSITQVINIMMAGAYKLRASDVHLEPQEEGVRLRYRIDGVLQDIATFPLKVQRPMTSRIKMISGMKLNLRDIAQDGTFEINMDDKTLDVRVSSIPGNFGESIVMRLLDPDSINVDVDSLGLQGLAYEIIQKQVRATNGMILTTGPTGSGKTTTLYSIINKLNTPDKKIITIEDPIEYEVKGISQTQVEKSRGYTFATGLRAIVRQDPDVVLVGEIRDEETADIAVNSALTGHLVLSTIHTNSAVATIPRLIELGVKPSLIAPSVNAIIGQRLVRKLCDCKEVYTPAKESIESIKKVLSIISPKAKVDIPKDIDVLYRPKGCPKCNNLGYHGRIGIFEIVTIGDELEKLILEMASKTELTISALESGMITMLQDGILKAVSGVTSMEEVNRVTGESEFLEKIYDQLMSQVLARKVLITQPVYEKTKITISNITAFGELIKKSPTTEVNKIIISAALMLNVGDIHIEPGADRVFIRFRIDGILKTVAELPLTEYPNLLGEVKLLSGMKTEVREGVVDSRFSIQLEEGIQDAKDKLVDVRVSIILGGYGETVVMRLLNQSAVATDILELGIRQENLDKIMAQVEKPNGLILNTGPTGSGKTTTLYSLLKQLNKPEVKIITVEDPIEYQMEGILQTPVNDKEGYTFATALRSLLRQNPDIMMIGEIRDNETAQIAVQAALTGHLVLSTIHTNNAAGSVQRFLNMGVSPADLSTAVNAFIAQRLVRKLCQCKEKVIPTEDELKKINAVLSTVSDKTGVTVPKKIKNIYKPKGCDLCNHIGYKGRTTVSEVLVIDTDIQELISQMVITAKIQAQGVANGMLTMAQDGILKVIEGETSLEEVMRVTEV